MKNHSPDPWLRQWQPVSPRSPSAFTADVMRQVRATRAEGLVARGLRTLAEFTDTWLPSPSILAPASLAVMLLLAGVHWSATRDEARSLAALRWQQAVTQTASPVSLAGAWQTAHPSHES